ncbi:MAG: hypothetical protein AUK26_00860 [Syntrophaceae bacterium CG2_30_58_14]|nr:MAG: hypothetical protein AUK26_00860 [Syntrophaceae bacterium CG2_30_58_14]
MTFSCFIMGEDEELVFRMERDELLHAAVPLTEESVGPLKPFLVDLDEGFQMILDTAIIICCLRIAGLIHGGWGGHDSSPPRKTGRLF